MTASDALPILGVAVGQSVALDCSCDACGSATTTTPLPGGPGPGGLDGRTFNEIYTCIETPIGSDSFCADHNVHDAIRFTHVGGGSYEVRDVPDTGFLSEGTIGCTTFAWVASSPGEYTESGTWNFTSDLESFSGSSLYLADRFAYTGQCNTTGAESPAPPRRTRRRFHHGASEADGRTQASRRSELPALVALATVVFGACTNAFRSAASRRRHANVRAPGGFPRTACRPP